VSCGSAGLDNFWAPIHAGGRRVSFLVRLTPEICEKSAPQLGGAGCSMPFSACARRPRDRALPSRAPAPIPGGFSQVAVQARPPRLWTATVSRPLSRINASCAADSILPSGDRNASASLGSSSVVPSQYRSGGISSSMEIRRRVSPYPPSSVSAGRCCRRSPAR
jgi:hypothetical protein